jgi:hypothetical protein
MTGYLYPTDVDNVGLAILTTVGIHQAVTRGLFVSEHLTPDRTTEHVFSFSIIIVVKAAKPCDSHRGIEGSFLSQCPEESRWFSSSVTATTLRLPFQIVIARKPWTAADGSASRIYNVEYRSHLSAALPKRFRHHATAEERLALLPVVVRLLDLLVHDFAIATPNVVVLLPVVDLAFARPLCHHAATNVVFFACCRLL